MTAEARLRALLHERIVVLDGAMGTMIQREKLDETGYRGALFLDHPKDLKGANDLLVLTQPAIVEGIHRQYLEAGADIVETNTFNAFLMLLSRPSTLDTRFSSLATALPPSKFYRDYTLSCSSQPRRYSVPGLSERLYHRG